MKKIFQPLITDIERMVEDQVNLVRVKRLNEGHPKANEIKVHCHYLVVSNLTGVSKRPYFSSAVLDRASISNSACKQPIRTFKLFNLRMHGPRSSSERPNYEWLDLITKPQQRRGTEPITRRGNNHFDRVNEALRCFSKRSLRRKRRRRSTHHGTQVHQKDACPKGK